MGVPPKASIRVFLPSIGIMEKKMETIGIIGIIMGLYSDIKLNPNKLAGEAIMHMNKFYRSVAQWLTELENHETGPWGPKLLVMGLGFGVWKESRGQFSNLLLVL